MRPHGGGQVASASGPGGQVLAPANALPDVTPTMSATYTWEDVVSVNYTRLPFPVPHARYMEAPLDTGRSAWRVMPQVLAWRLRHGERALVIDVQSSVPGEILTRGIDLARSRVELTAGSSCCPGAASPCPDGDEPWIASEELWTFTGPPRADAVVGPLLYCASPYARDAVHLVRSLGQLADQLARTASPLPFLAGPGNHDTIPVDPSLVRLLLMYLWFLPGAIPFLFSGAEHGILTAVNREFGFSLTEQEALSYDRLQMFSPGPVDWDSCHDTSQQARLAPFVRLLLAARRVAGEWLRPGQPLTLMPVRTQGEPTCPAIGYHVGEGTPSPR